MHEAVDEYLQARRPSPDVYMCGPPPMVEAAEEMLAARKIDEQRIFMDKFTTSPRPRPAEAATPPSSASSGRPGDESERDFTWYTPRKRRATLYEDVTIDTQPSVHRHLKRGWPVRFEDGRGTWDDGSTALRCDRLVRLPRPRRAVGAALLPGRQRDRAADRGRDALGRGARGC